MKNNFFMEEKMKKVFGIAALFIAFAVVFSGCASSGGSGKAPKTREVFGGGTFSNGAKLKINDLVSLDEAKISAVPVVKEENEGGWEYLLVIEFDEPVDISSYNSLYMDWDGIYGGDFGGVSFSCVLTTGDGKIIDIGGGWSQRNGENERKQPLYKQYFPFKATLLTGERDNQITFAKSRKNCKSIEISTGWGMRAGDESEGWQWFGLDFEELKPFLIEALYFTNDPGPNFDFRGSGK